MIAITPMLDLPWPAPVRSKDWLGRVLVACERSGKVRDQFRARGCNAWSCDLLPQEGEGPHLIEDVLRRLTCCPDNHGRWDMMIAHPPCTYVSGSGWHWTVRGLRDRKLTDEAIRFAEALWDAPIARICIENPVGMLSTLSKLGKPTQIVQPYEFGDDASKKTCLWLKGLPPLVKDPAKRFPGRWVEWPKGSGKMVERWSNQTDSGQNKLPPSDDRWMERARTYTGIAEAMADQWCGKRPNVKHCDAPGVTC